MRRSGVNTKDMFRPRGQVAREIELAESAAQEVVEILGDRLSDARLQRIDEVIRHRTRLLTIAIDGVYDPHNAAAVIRTADAFGLQTVHVIEQEARFLSSRKVTQGAHKWVDLMVWKQAERFAESVQKEGKKILVAEANSAIPLGEIDSSEPLALVFGNEHNGISPKMKEMSDGSFSIPMFGFTESVNVSVAAAITLAALRGKGEGGLSGKESEVLRARFYLRSVRAGYDIVMLERKKRNR